MNMIIKWLITYTIFTGAQHLRKTFLSIDFPILELPTSGALFHPM